MVHPSDKRQRRKPERESDLDRNDYSEERHLEHERKRNIALYPTMFSAYSKSNQWMTLSPDVLDDRHSPKCSLGISTLRHPILLPVQPPPRTPPRSVSRRRVMRSSNIRGYQGPTSPPNPLRLASTKSNQTLPRPTPSPLLSRLIPYLCYEQIGGPHLNVFRVKLPRHLREDLLDLIIDKSERYANVLPYGWKTDLYSLTKCDMACRDIPGMLELVKPVFEYMCHTIQILYGCQKVVVDKNQPHILKYSAKTGHTGVELHHDRCDITANLTLSKSQTYQGGGTILPDIGRVVQLEQGEFLLHPGSLVHGGMDITDGSRYLLVIFAHLK